MIHIVSPEIHPGLNAFFMENLLKILQRAHAVFFPRPLAAAENDLPFVIHFDPGMVGRHVRQKTFR